MSTKHTPGPWRYGSPSTTLVYGADGWSVCEMGAYNQARVDADARLIAAAPDLLEALKKCASVCAGDTVSKQGLIDALTAARAAIVKATGESE